MGQRSDVEARWLTAGGNMAATWRVTDLMLWEPIAQGKGLADHEPALVAYEAGYLTMIQSRRSITTACTVEDVTMQPGIYEWPLGSGAQFFGVECTLTVREVI